MRIGAHEVARRAGCSYRQFDYWRRAGLFGPTKTGLGSGGHRSRFTIYDQRDVLLATVATQVAAAFGPGRLHVSTLRDIAHSVAAGSDDVSTDSPHVRLVIDVAAIQAGIDAHEDVAS